MPLLPGTCPLDNPLLLSGSVHKNLRVLFPPKLGSPVETFMFMCVALYQRLSFILKIMSRMISH